MRQMSFPKSVLFLCTGNSARSVLAESLLNVMGAPEFIAYSAGSKPKGRIHPAALSKLGREGHPISTLRSKSWDEFAAPDAPAIDVIITVCDNAASESCPVWPGHPLTAHWGIPDPDGSYATTVDEEAAFDLAYRRLEQRITAFLALSLDDRDTESLSNALMAIGTIRD